MSKIFLSFLGTTLYTECNYVYKDQRAENVHFVQEALLQFFAGDFGPADKIFIYLTEQAREVNWLPSDNGPGLQAVLRQKNLQAQIMPTDIPRGDSEQEIWDIFNIVFSGIEPGDEVILDITHGFRSLPMLGIVLLNYARMLKNIRIRGIYYGAFEVLGPAYKVRDMDPEQRNAPVFNLTSFETLQQWTAGADNFIHYGNSQKLVSLIKDEISPQLKEKKGRDEQLNNLKKLANTLNHVAGLFQTNRGTMIFEGNYFKELREAMQRIRDIRFKALNPILDQLEHKLQNFMANDIRNGFAAVRWCIKHNLVQQGITILQETIISLLLLRRKRPFNSTKPRMAVSSALSFIKKPIPQDHWNENAKLHKDLVDAVIKDPLARALSGYYNKLSESRNSINHGGYLDHRKPGSFEKQLIQIDREVERILQQYLE